MGKGMKPALYQDHLKISDNMAKVKKTKEFTAHKNVTKKGGKTIYSY